MSALGSGRSMRLVGRGMAGSNSRGARRRVRVMPVALERHTAVGVECRDRRPIRAAGCGRRVDGVSDLGRLTDDDALAVLGLAGPADLDRARAAFLRLARLHHPDLKRSPTDADHIRFVRIVNAYHHLKRTLGARSAGPDVGLCAGCGRRARLREGIGGVARCLDCLLGVARRRRLLPLPTWETVRHGGVIALEAVTVVCIILGAATSNSALVLTGAAAITTALLVLATTCIRIGHTR